MPVAAFPGRHGWGYDGVHLYAVHEPYGGPDALQRFVDAATRVGLAVCLDVVYNHLGPSGNYLRRVRAVLHRPAHHAVGPGGQPRRHGQHRGAPVDLSTTRCGGSRSFHLDALRLDAVHALADDCPTHLLAQLSSEAAELSTQLGRPLGLVAESDLNDPRMVEPVAEGGLGHDRAVERRLPPCAARAADRRARRATTWTSVSPGCSPRR